MRVARRALTPFVLRSLAIVGTAFGARLFFVVFAPFQAGDSSEYEAIALNLLGGHGFALHPSSPTAFRPPGYPLFIAAVYAVTGPDPAAVLLAQAGVGACATWFVYVLGRRLLGDPPAFIGALLAGLYPHLAFYAGTILSETLAYFFLALAMLLGTALREGRRRALSGLGTGMLLGAAALTAPRLALFPLALAAQVFAAIPWRRALATLTLVAIGLGAVLMPWTLRNVITFGTPIPLTLGQGAFNVWLSAYRTGVYDYRLQERAKTEPLIARWLDLYDGADKAARERELVPARRELEEELMADAWRRIAADPAGFAEYRLRAMVPLWIQPAVYAGHFRRPFEGQNLRLEEMVASGNWIGAALRFASAAVFTVGLYVGALLGLWTQRRRWRELAPLYVPALYVLVVHSVLIAEHRYSVLSHPFLWLLAAAGWLSVVAEVRRFAARRSS